MVKADEGCVVAWISDTEDWGLFYCFHDQALVTLHTMINCRFCHFIHHMQASYSLSEELGVSIAEPIYSCGCSWEATWIWSTPLVVTVIPGKWNRPSKAGTLTDMTMLQASQVAKAIQLKACISPRLLPSFCITGRIA